MTRVDVDLSNLLISADELGLAGRYDTAQSLLHSVGATDPAARLELLATEAEVVLRRSYARGGPARGEDLTRAAAALAPDERMRWDLDMLSLRARYADRLAGSTSHETTSDDALAAEADRLHASAADARRRGWASMCRGWIADNLRGERAVAPASYEEALDVGRTEDDAMLVFEAQRHLGDHAHDEGRHHDALAAWQESAAAAARAGYVSGVLAQLLLLAVLARDVGDEAGAVLLATEVGRWAEAVGATARARQTSAFLSGVDPTRPPEPRP